MPDIAEDIVPEDTREPFTVYFDHASFTSIPFRRENTASWAGEPFSIRYAENQSTNEKSF